MFDTNFAATDLHSFPAAEVASCNPSPAALVSSEPKVLLGGPIEIWTDGGCRPNPGPGGWAAILRGAKGEECIVSGAEPDTTNNRMELTAAINALEALKRPCRVMVYADSQYVQCGMTVWLPRWQAARWRTAKGKPVENRYLWERLVAAAAPHAVDWKWTRGHAGDPMNERADRLAAKARDQTACR